LARAGDAAAGIEALESHVAAVRAARPLLGELRAAVEVIIAACRELDGAVADRERAEAQAAAAEQRAEEERGYRADAQRAAARAESAFTVALDEWRSDPRAVEFEPPAELGADTVTGIGPLARTAAEPVLSLRREEEKVAGARRAAAAGELETARIRREQVAAERDPAPPEPAWGRDPREAADGAAFWQLVDFAGGLDPDACAGLEAALQASGLLDAWVRADGTVLDGDRRDTVLPLGPAVPGGAMPSVLVAAPPAGSPVPAAVVDGLLARVCVAGRTGGESASPVVSTGGESASAVVSTDGAWRLGPLTGRATKPAAQYIGATARAAERERRLAELDAAIESSTAARDDAAAAEQVAHEAAGAIESWLAAVPGADPLVAAWAELDARTRTAERADRVSTEAEQAATGARGIEAGRRRELDELASGHGLPTEPGALAARREELRDLDADLARHADNATSLVARLRRWADDAAAAEHDLAESDQAGAAQLDAEQSAEAARAAADELEQTVGAPVREIRRRIAEAQTRDAELKSRAGELGERVATLLAQGGAAGQAATDAADRLAEHEPVLAGAVATLAALGDTPGLLDSGRDSDLDLDSGQDLADPVFDLARGFTEGQPVPAAVLSTARRFAELPAPARGGTETAVYTAWQDAASGPAGDVDPRVGDIGGALAVIGRDDTGEHPIGVLAQRLAAAVARDADLLTDRERRLFEEHILGDLGESLRARRLESEELVTEMNALLRGVTTSQGISVQLRWALRDDVAADARRAVELLGRPVGALLPDERRELRDALHRLIEASRADAPEDSYSEHLARALDYRRWFAFRIRYTRPENAGAWHDLHRRSPLSQGEQKVVCYLPLFAAAAAHFSSLAGAAPYSPRFVLLDDAFPKIDVRTHPLLFGLLVQLDLDFVVTSERLWGDHATVPSLAIYEALRDPAERGIAQYRHTWDGHRLQAVGA
ncbi:MAG: TIGR02680 family protein, partial [Pseudonocardia sp.]|nr:TIGR02680 family protein [Pseudonocardia sp.]